MAFTDFYDYLGRAVPYFEPEFFSIDLLLVGFKRKLAVFP